MLMPRLSAMVSEITGLHLAEVVGTAFDDTIAPGKGSPGDSGYVGHLYGGRGNDTYIISRPNTFVHELKDEGTDSVFSPFSYDLAGQYIENPTLNGTEVINATGNLKNNVLTGNDGANVLDGMFGIDEVHGGKGNDNFIVGQAGDKVYELVEEVDTVQSAITYDLCRPAYREPVLDRARCPSTPPGTRSPNVLLGNDACRMCSTEWAVSTRCNTAKATTGMTS